VITLQPLRNGNGPGETGVYTLASWDEPVDEGSDDRGAPPTTNVGVDGRSNGADQDTTSSYTGLGIIEPPDGAIFTKRDQIMVSIRVPLGTAADLVANGSIVPDAQIGQKVVRVGDGVEERTYFGVEIQKGWNALILRAKPVRGPSLEDSVAVALAGQPRQLTAEQDRVLVPANGIASRTIRFKVLDQYGLSVIDGVVGTVVEGDTLLLNTDARPAMPGFQVATREGYFHLQLKSRQRTGRSRVVVALGEMSDWCEVAYVPPRRPAFVSGIMQATLGSFDASGDADPLGLEHFHDGARLDGDARFIAQGTGRGGVNLTARMDTKKRYDDPLLKTINPDQQYSIYGDASQMYYAAPSQGGNYVAVEKGESFLRYGDFRSPFTQGEFLTYRRSTTGLSTALVSGGDRVRGFVAESDFATFQDEIPGDGTSGFYYLTHTPVVENSINIILQTRDRFQDEKILDSRPLVQFRDYTINFFDGAILFKEPIPVTTDELNPIVIVANYEVRTDREGQYLYGFRGDMARFGRFNLGAEAVGGGRNGLDYKLYGVDGGATFYGLGLSGEFARSEDQIAGDGNAYKVGASYHNTFAEGSFYYREVSEDFANPSFADSKAQRFTKKTGFDARARLSPEFAIESNGFYHDLEGTDETQTNLDALGIVEKRGYSFSAGARTATQATQSADDRSLLSLVGVGLRRTNGLDFRTHWEHNLRDEIVPLYPDRVLSLLAIPLQKRFKLITNYEYRTTHEQPATHQFLSGVEAHLRPGAVAYTKYSMNRTASDNRMGAISGLRQKFRLTDDLSGLLNIEGQLSFSGSSSSEYFVVKTGLNRLKRGVSLIEGQYEYRWQTMSNRHLVNLIATRKLDDGLAILFKNALSATFLDAKKTGIHSEGRLAAVYRPDVSRVRTLLLLRSAYDRFSPIDPLGITWRLVFSTDVNLIPAQPHELRLKFAAKRVEDYSFHISETTNNYLVLAQYVFRFARVWDFDVWGRFLGQGGVGTEQLGAGAEIGRLFFNQVRVSAGYAINGFEEKDLSENDAWAKGFGIRVQYILSDWILNELGF
jgi:hypothetical protein